MPLPDASLRTSNVPPVKGIPRSLASALLGVRKSAADPTWISTSAGSERDVDESESRWGTLSNHEAIRDFLPRSARARGDGPPAEGEYEEPSEGGGERLWWRTSRRWKKRTSWERERM